MLRREPSWQQDNIIDDSGNDSAISRHLTTYSLLLKDQTQYNHDNIFIDDPASTEEATWQEDRRGPRQEWQRGRREVLLVVASSLASDLARWPCWSPVDFWTWRIGSCTYVCVCLYLVLRRLYLTFSLEKAWDVRNSFRQIVTAFPQNILNINNIPGQI